MATILGTNAANRLRGRITDDQIDGLGGNDTITGGGGNDRVNAGAGNDRVTTNSGNDRIIADAGNDFVNAGGGKDTIEGGNGNDSLFGGDGNDTIRGGVGNDLLDGENGDDVMTADAGLDTLIGGFGSDFMSGGGGDDELNSHNSANNSTEWEVDEMYGGAGTNTFNLFSNYKGGGANILNPTSEKSYAIIWDFKEGDALNLLDEVQEYSISYGSVFDPDTTDDVDLEDTIISLNGNVVTVVVDSFLIAGDFSQIGATLAPEPLA